MGLQLIAASFWGDPNSYLAILMVAVGLGAVIFVHELGHFLVAKACGVKCEKFYIGFDVFDIKIAGRVIVPRALIKFQWGETQYGVGIIPLGGYVKMLGQDDNPTRTAEEMERSKIRRSGQPGEGETEELDPRSYQAKSVWQRMAIISAGVIMNLIFAVLFATLAFPLGVPFTPCEIGSTVPGSPAWVAGLQPGDRILQIGRGGKRTGYLRFGWDLAQTVAANGDQRDLELLIRKADGGEPVWLKLRPQRIQLGFESHATIGVRPSLSTELREEEAVVRHLAAGRADPPLLPGDKIVAIDGQPIETYLQLKRILAQKPEADLTLTVERKDEKTGQVQRVDVHVPPNPMKLVGLWMRTGPVRAVQVHSPAERAGIKVNDRLVALDGKPIGDPFTLAHRLRRRAGQTVRLTIARGRHEKTVEVTCRQPITSATFDPQRPIAIDEIGIAVEVLAVVEHVEPGGPADQAGLKAGDQILSAQFVPADEEKKRYEEEKLGLSHRPIDLVERPLDWPVVHEQMQWSLPDTELLLGVQRDSQTLSVRLRPRPSTEWFNQTRGILLQAKQEIFVAESLSEAFALGLQRTWEDATRVVVFLRKLFSGGISPTNLGGPGSIAVVATAEAAQGPSRLLIFLTFLSANLAVINFLPIPILDGGHMVFLTYELITRRRPSEKWFVGLSIAGLAFILSLMLFVIGLDVFRLASYFTSG